MMTGCSFSAAAEIEALQDCQSRISDCKGANTYKNLCSHKLNGD